MVSRVIKEDSRYLYLQRYLRDEPDEYSEWELNEKGQQKYSQRVHDAEHYAFYQFKVLYRIDKETGEISYDAPIRR